ncbi:hypothetical protein NKJ46_26370 [Mesorhizobium sp. M0166]|uniref:hypothetical protein n=1 Tax=unclassified Mesorhizobium TaxID=325217 RepID=UPI00333AB07C
MNFDVVDIKLLRDHSTELAQFGPTPLDLGIAPNMEVTDHQMVAAHVHVPQELKHAIGRDDIKEEAWVLRNVSVQNEFDVIGLHTRSLRKLLIASMSGAGERQGLTDPRLAGCWQRPNRATLAQSTLIDREKGTDAAPYIVAT